MADPKSKEAIDRLRASLNRPDFQKLELDVGRTPFPPESGKSEFRKLERPVNEAELDRSEQKSRKNPRK